MLNEMNCFLLFGHAYCMISNINIGFLRKNGEMKWEMHTRLLMKY